MSRDIELGKVDLSFGVLATEDGEPVVPVAILTVMAIGNDVPTLQDNPLEMLAVMMEQIAARHEEGLIKPTKTYDVREQEFDIGSPE